MAKKHKYEPIADVYPYNLALSVFDTDDIECLWNVNFRELVLSVSELTEREQKVIELRYDKKLTLEQCGMEFNVTRERIRQIEAKALRKLRHPRFVKRWKMVSQEEAWKANEEADRLRLENITMRDKLKQIADIVGVKMAEIEPAAEVEDMTVDELELSVRSYNCIKRAGYNKVSDFIGKTDEDLMKIRNLGRKSMEEIKVRLAEHGVIING